MKMKMVIAVFVGLGSLTSGSVSAAEPAAAASPQEAFAAANADYFAGRYGTAARSYAEILETHRLEDPVLYHNLGNALFRSGAYGSAILYYRRAMRLGPTPDVTEALEGNLDAARRTLQARYRSGSDKAQFIFAEPGSLFYKATHLLSRTALGVLFAVLWILWLGLLVMRRLRAGQRGLGRAAVPIGIAMLLSGILLWGQIMTDTNFKVGVVVSEGMKLRDGRHETAQGKDIPEGMEVRIVERTEGWTRVELATGNQGWVQAKAVREI